MRNALCLIVVLLAVPAGQAQFFDELPYEDQSDFSAGFDGLPAFVSAATQYNATDVRNAVLMFGTSGVTMEGMTHLCWKDGSGKTNCRNGVDVTVEIEDGGSFGFRTPETYALEMQAGHALTFFMDASQMFGNDSGESGESANLSLGPSLVTIPTQEQLQIVDVEDIPTPDVDLEGESDVNEDSADIGLLLTLSDNTTMVIRHDDEGVLETLSGSGQWVGFDGDPRFTVTTADMAVLPMPDGAAATFTPATDEAASEGLSSENLAAAFGGLEGGGQDGATDPGQEGEGTGFTGAIQNMAPFLNGAYLDLGLSAPDAGQEEEVDAGGLLGSVTLVRFDEMQATREGTAVSYQGDAPLQVDGGEVAGAQPLIGGIIPMLSIILWGVAIAATVAVILLRPRKENKLWDGLHWIGRIAAPLALVVVFFIWDAAMADLWGASLLSGGVTGTAKGVIAVLEIVPLLLAGLFFGMPSRFILRAATRFAGQGRMMNAAGIVAPFVTLIFGLPLMLSLVNSVLGLVSGA